MSQLKNMAEEECEMEMTSMIDVTFLLLIFFMCTLKFKTLEGKLAAYLPKDVGVNTSEAEPIEKVEILIRADQSTPFKHIQKVMELCGLQGIQIWKVQLAAAENAPEEEVE